MRPKLRCLLKLKQSGQTMVEYVLLLAVVVSIAFTIFRRIDEYLVSNPDSFQNKYLRGFASVLGNSADTNIRGRYKRFRIPR